MNGAASVPRIDTRRLALRGLTESDIAFLFQHFSKREVNEFSSENDLTTIDEAKELYAKYVAPRSTLFRLGMVLKKTGELIGTLGFYGIDHENARATVGFDLAKQYWGKGLMGEALGALLDYGFREMRLNRIEATVDPSNTRCLRVLGRCGFAREGVQRQKSYYKGAYHDDAIYSLLRSEWVAKQDAQ
ncbi:MAG TPA: GNAT family protein [Terriglobales bacterium]|nr:GNAT family protein [Terriglobales bacterium]